MARSMFAHVRANAVSYVALFVALGGTSYAALRLPANSVGAAGAAGAPGTAKAFAVVDPASCTVASGCSVTKAKNVSGVQRVGKGIYCVTITSGVNRDADIAIAGVDFNTTAAPEGEASAMSDSRSLGCGAAANVFQVVTHSTTAGAASDIGFWVAIL